MAIGHQNGLFRNIGLALGLVIALAFAFLHLTALPIRMWDEARLATSVYEMMITHQYWITTFGWEEDLWSTKPPLMIWLQLVFSYLLGYNELAVRLPSALASFSIAWIIYEYVRNELKSEVVALLTALIFISSSGFFTIHVARTGDYDALLSCFCLLYLLSAVRYFSDTDPKSWYSFLFFATAAGMVKGIQGFIFFPAILLNGFFFSDKKKIIRLFLAQSVAVGVLLTYYLFREWNHPGFLRIIWENEWGGRYAGTLENHSGDLNFYLDYLYSEGFSFWFGLYVVSVLYAHVFRRSQNHILISSSALFYLAVISMSKTKVFWYLAPLYPLMAISCGYFLEEVYLQFRNHSALNTNSRSYIYIYI